MRMADIYHNLLNPARVRLALVFLLDATILAIFLGWILSLPISSYAYIGFLTLGFAVLSIDVVPLFERQPRFIGIVLFLSLYLGFWLVFDGFTVVILSLLVTMVRNAYRNWPEWKEDSGRSLLPLFGITLVFGIILNQMIISLIVSVTVLIIHQWNQLRFVRNTPHAKWIVGSQMFFILILSGIVALLSSAASRLQPILDWIVLRLLEPIFKFAIYLIEWLRSKRKPRPDQGDLGEDFGNGLNEVREKTEINQPTWVQDLMDVLFVVLTIAIIVGGIYFLWQRMKKYGINRVDVQEFHDSVATEEKKSPLFRWFRKDRRSQAVVVDPIRGLYIDYLRLVEKVRLERAPHLTVNEFADIVLEQYGDLRFPIEKLTFAYEQCRYGDEEMNVDELNSLRDSLLQIRVRLLDSLS